MTLSSSMMLTSIRRYRYLFIFMLCMLLTMMCYKGNFRVGPHPNESDMMGPRPTDVVLVVGTETDDDRKETNKRYRRLRKDRFVRGGKKRPATAAAAAAAATEDAEIESIDFQDMSLPTIKKKKKGKGKGSTGESKKLIKKKGSTSESKKLFKKKKKKKKYSYSKKINPRNFLKLHGKERRLVEPGYEQDLEDVDEDLVALKQTFNSTHSPLSIETPEKYYFIYDDPLISQSARLRELRENGCEKSDCTNLDHVAHDAQAEYNVLHALEHHPLRTYEPNHASIFIIPTPITELLLYGCQWEDCDWYDEAFSALYNHTIFQKYSGQKHVLISFSWLSFSRKYEAFIPALSRHYHHLENVTVANHFDPYGARELSYKNKGTSLDFQSVFLDEGLSPVSNSAFSIGLGLGYGQKTFPIKNSTYETFQSSRNFLFYHTRETRFSFGSTKYRRALLNESITSRLPASSIGYGIMPDVFLKDINSSKFCPVLRGDTPHSHSLLWAIRAGCIPVVISDAYSIYAPSFKSSLRMKDFCIFIDEATFTSDPLFHMMALSNLTEPYIRDKLNNLTRAQTVLFPDHPDSQFVEAFFKEAQEAMEARHYNLVPLDPVTAINGNVDISGHQHQYRFPSTFAYDIDNEEQDDNTKSSVEGVDVGISIKVGVLSSASNYTARANIRQTWAQKNPSELNRKGRHDVFFILSGPWKAVADEFFSEGDIFWVDTEEDSDLLIKTRSFLHAVENRGGRYDYVIKTHDDVYAGLEEIKRILSHHQPDYWGNCVYEDYRRRPSKASTYGDNVWPTDELYPVFAEGFGYALSRNFNQCAQKAFETKPFISSWPEDVSVGIAAKDCNINCSSVEWANWDEFGVVEPIRIYHNIIKNEYMWTTHWENKRQLKVAEFENDEEFD